MGSYTKSVDILRIPVYIFIFSETRIGVDTESLTVSEKEGTVEVCVVVFIPVIPCPIAFPFHINVYTEPNSTSEALV